MLIQRKQCIDYGSWFILTENDNVGRKLGETMQFLQTLGLFILTSVAEIVGCYLPWLWLKKEGSIWLLVPAGFSLAAFAWLLTLHPQIAGRTYAAYGGVYVAVAVIWMWLVDGVRPDRWDVIGAAVTLAGMTIIFFAPRSP